MANNPVELPHLLRCKSCGVPNGHNAERCWGCGVGLSAAPQALASPLLRRMSGDAPGATAGHTERERTSAPPPSARRGRSIAAAVALVLAVTAFAALRTPRADRASQRPSADVASTAPLQAGAGALTAASGATAPPDDAGEADQAAPQGEAPTTTSAQQAAWALGIAAEPTTPLKEAPGASACRDVDRALGLCQSETTAEEQR